MILYQTPFQTTHVSALYHYYKTYVIIVQTLYKNIYLAFPPTQNSPDGNGIVFSKAKIRKAKR